MISKTHQDTEHAPGNGAFGDAVRRGLGATQPSLPSKYLYDEVGSQLFEAICFLPEYYLTRAERSILDAHAAAIVAHLEPEARLVELGAGSAVKTRILLKAMVERHADLVYCPIDISDEAMRIAAANITSEFPTVRFQGVVGDWIDALGRLTAVDDTQKLVLFLGSSIGNLDDREAVAFLEQVRKRLGPRDKLLLGTDLVKDPAVLLAAYDDAAGVTAAFNRNLLVRINTELGGRFDTRAFRHEARWDPARRRIEMHLVSEVDQRVWIEDLDLFVDLPAGRSIHTESSHKYRQEDVEDLCRRAGLGMEGTWTDAEGRFAVHLIGREA